MKKILLFASAVAMLASCSKDLTEDLAPAQVIGKSTIYASYEDASVGGTRTEVGRVDGKITTTWDETDVLGVFNAKAGDDTNTPFVYAAVEAGSAKGEFKGDLDILAAGEYVGYYPWERDAEISEDGDITLTIPAKQNYRFNAKNTNGSFAANVAPAVAYGEATSDNKLDMSFYAVASYMYVPVAGVGTVKTIRLEIDGVALSGEVSVNMADVKEGDLSKVTTPTGSGSVTVKCGEKGIDLTETPTYFWFVIPGNLEIEDATVNFYVNEAQKPSFSRTNYKKETTPGNAFGLAVDGVGTPFMWVEDAEDAFIISKPEEFLQYAYLATYFNANEGPTGFNAIFGDKESADKLRPIFFDGDNAMSATLKKAVIIKDLKFFENGVSTVVVPADRKEFNALSAFDQLVLGKYEELGYAIETIGHDEKTISYNIKGAGKNGVTLDGLKVKGNGIFGGATDSSTANNEVNNLTLKNVTVTTPEETEVAYFVTENPRNAGVRVYNLTIDGGTIETEAEKAALAGNAFTNAHFTTDNSWAKVKAYPVCGDVEVMYANELTLMTPSFDFDEDLNTLINVPAGKTAFDKFYTVAASGAGAHYINVADEAFGTAQVQALLEAEKLSQKSEEWISIIGADGTSYWTGIIPNAEDSNEDVFTAEELAYVVTTIDLDTEITLTNDLDLVNQSWVEGVTGSKKRLAVKGAGKTISNVKIDNAKKYYTLFGSYAAAQALNVSNIEIAVSEEANAPVVAVMAQTGGQMTNSAVVVTGLKISVPEEVEPANNVIGGLYASINQTYLERVANTASKVEFAEDGKNFAETIKYGYIAGQVVVAADGKDTTFKAAAAYNDPFGAVVVNITAPENLQSTNLRFANLTETQIPESIVALGPNTTKIGHTVFVYFGEAEKMSYYLQDEKE